LEATFEKLYLVLLDFEKSTKVVYHQQKELLFSKLYDHKFGV